MKTQQSKKTGKWWVVGLPEGMLPVGPSETRREADEDRVGLAKFFRGQDKRHFVTVDEPRREAARAKAARRGKVTQGEFLFS